MRYHPNRRYLSRTHVLSSIISIVALVVLSVFVYCQCKEINRAVAATEMGGEVIRTLALQQPSNWDGHAWHLAASALLVLRGRSEAQPVYEKACSLHPDEPRLLYDLAHLYVLDGEHSNALQALDRLEDIGGLDSATLEGSKNLRRSIGLVEPANRRQTEGALMPSRSVRCGLLLILIAVILTGVMVLARGARREPFLYFVACESPQHAEAVMAELERAGVQCRVQIGVLESDRDQLLHLVLRTRPGSGVRQDATEKERE